MAYIIPHCTPFHRTPSTSTHTSPSPAPPTTCSRRTILKALSLVALTTFPSPPPARAVSSRSVINSILSAYGLPTIRDISGYSPLLEQYATLVVQFQYPSAWIINRTLAPVADRDGLRQANGLMSRGTPNVPLEGRTSGLTVGDYRRAEGLSFFVCDAPSSAKHIHQVPAAFIARLVTPGDARGLTPDVTVLRTSVDDDGYRILDTRYESITASGYSVGRRARVRATVLRDGKLYALAGTCSEIRWKKMIQTIDTSLDSFRVFRL